MKVPIYQKGKNTAEELKAIIFAEERFDEAAYALIDLAKLDKLDAKIMALEILNSKKGDIFYQASAFDVLYDISQQVAVVFIRENAHKAETYLLATMLSDVTADSGTLTEQGQEKVKEAAAILKDALSKRSPQELESISEEVEWFKKTFGAA